MTDNSKQQNAKDLNASNKKQAFKEGNMDNTGKLNKSSLQKETTKENIPSKGSKQKNSANH